MCPQNNEGEINPSLACGTKSVYKSPYKNKLSNKEKRRVNHIFALGAMSVNNSPYKRINYHKKIKPLIKTKKKEKFTKQRGEFFERMIWNADLTQI